MPHVKDSHHSLLLFQDRNLNFHKEMLDLSVVYLALNGCRKRGVTVVSREKP